MLARVGVEVMDQTYPDHNTEYKGAINTVSSERVSLAENHGLTDYVRFSTNF